MREFSRLPRKIVSWVDFQPCLAAPASHADFFFSLGRGFAALMELSGQCRPLLALDRFAKDVSVLCKFANPFT